MPQIDLAQQRLDTVPFGTPQFSNAQATVTPAASRATLRFQDYMAMSDQNFGIAVDVSATADVTTALQNFLLYCQMTALALKGTGLDNLFQNDCVTAALPRGIYHVSCPIIVPRYVNLHCEGVIERAPNWSTGGTLAYTGDTTSQALNNQFQPVVILVPGSRCDKINFYCNPDGNSAHQGNGMVSGKTWTASSVTKVSGGSGYSVNDVVIGNQPAKSPYFGFNITVTGVDGSGAITSWTQNSGGAYDLPTVLQGSQWTAGANSNNFTDVNGGGNIFTSNNSGVFNTNGGTGTGATFSVNWTPDYATSSSIYNCGPGNIISDIHIGSIFYEGVPLLANGNAICCGLMCQNLNHTLGEMEGTGGFYGLYLRSGADFRANIINPVNAGNPIAVFSWGSAECANCILDTPTQYLGVLDQCSNIRFSGVGLNGFAIVNTPTHGGWNIGPSSSGHNLTDIYLDFQFRSNGVFDSSSYSPAYIVQNTTSGYFRASVFNDDGTGSSVACKTSQIAAIGANVGENVVFEGQIDLVTSTMSGANITSGPLFVTTSSTSSSLVATVPSGGCHVWDAAVKGYAGPNGTYEIWGSGAPTGGTSGTGVNKAGPDSIYHDVTNDKNYINTNTAASPTWVLNSAQTKSVQIPLTGFTITMTTGKLLLTPAGTLATGTINMPANPVDSQVATICSTTQITALTMASSTGETLLVPATFLAPGTPNSWEYDATSNSWIPT